MNQIGLNGYVYCISLDYDTVNVIGMTDIHKYSMKMCRVYMFQSSGCNDALVIYFAINNIVVLNIHGVDYRCIILGLAKVKPLKL